jgi:hypothetical protein
MDARILYAGFRLGVDSHQFQAGDARLIEETPQHSVHITGLELQNKHVGRFSSAMARWSRLQASYALPARVKNLLGDRILRRSNPCTLKSLSKEVAFWWAEYWRWLEVRPEPWRRFSLRQPTSAPVGLCGAIALEILLFCRDFHAREFEGLGQAGLKRAWRMDFSPDPLYQLQRYRPRFRNLINASSVVVSKPSPSGESVRFPTRNSRFRNLAFRGSEKLLFWGG